jgi:hypothetical protein
VAVRLLQAAALLQFDGFLAKDLEAFDQRFEELDHACVTPCRFCLCFSSNSKC